MIFAGIAKNHQALEVKYPETAIHSAQAPVSSHACMA